MDAPLKFSPFVGIDEACLHANARIWRSMARERARDVPWNNHPLHPVTDIPVSDVIVDELRDRLHVSGWRTKLNDNPERKCGSSIVQVYRPLPEAMDTNAAGGGGSTSPAPSPDRGLSPHRRARARERATTQPHAASPARVTAPSMADLKGIRVERVVRRARHASPPRGEPYARVDTCAPGAAGAMPHATALLLAQLEMDAMQKRLSALMEGARARGGPSLLGVPLSPAGARDDTSPPAPHPTPTKAPRADTSPRHADSASGSDMDVSDGSEAPT